jgi:hypothetical protein
VTLRSVPRQPDFTIENEEWGKIVLEDNTTVESRFVLSDIIVTGEDILGPQIMFSHVVVVRAKSPSDLIEKVRDKLLATLETPPPLTAEAGYEPIKIKKVEKPTRSTYRFEGYLLSIEVNIESVVRNSRYKTPSGGPVYNIRWILKYNISKTPT